MKIVWFGNSSFLVLLRVVVLKSTIGLCCTVPHLNKLCFFAKSKLFNIKNKIKLYIFRRKN